jgi:hypothetical protein
MSDIEVDWGPFPIAALSDDVYAGTKLGEE